VVEFSVGAGNNMENRFGEWRETGGGYFIKDQGTRKNPRLLETHTKKKRKTYYTPHSRETAATVGGDRIVRRE